MAKTYQNPDMKVIKVKVQKLICTSHDDGGGGGGIPAREAFFEDFE